MINYIALILLLTSSVCFAGLPPTTSKDSGDTSGVTTFNFQFPNFAGTHTGTTFSLGLLSPQGGGTGVNNSSNLTILGTSSINGTNTNDVTLGAFGSSGNANGASLSGQVLTLQPTDGTNPGGVTAGTQTIGGAKTFTSTLQVDATGPSGWTQIGNLFDGGTVRLSYNNAWAEIGADGLGLTSADSVGYALFDFRNEGSPYYDFIGAANTPLFVLTGTGLTLENGAGQLNINGSSSGSVSIIPQAASGTYNFNLPTTAGTSGYALTSGGGGSTAMGWTALNTGTVTSVGMTVPSFLSVSGSPITSSGTLGVSLSGTALPILNGGTGTTSTTQYGVVYGSSTTALATTAAGTVGYPLVANSSAAPTFQQLSLTAGVTGVLPVLNGGTAVTSVTISPTASNFAGWDSHKNLSANNFMEGFLSTATAAGTTGLTISAAQIQVFTGSTTQTVTLPTSSIGTGTQYTIINLSTGVVTVEASGGGTIQAMASNTILTATSIAGTPTTAAGWKWVYENLDGSLPMINPMSTGGDTIYGGASGVPTRLANGTSGQVLQSAGSTSAPTWSTLPGNTTALKAPTVQKFASGTGTYTLPSGPAPLYIKVIMVGAGGGGAGGGTGAGTGGTGGNTTFGTSLLAANGGGGGVPNAGGGAGGTASLGSGPIGTAATGGIGQGSAGNSSATNATGGGGGVSPFGGAGAGVPNNNAGTAAATNSGSGGGGGSATIANASPGGGAGGYIDAIINSPSASYSYAVGAAGTAGTAGTSGSVGGAGGSGYIIVFEYYQ